MLERERWASELLVECAYFTSCFTKTATDLRTLALFYDYESPYPLFLLVRCYYGSLANSKTFIARQVRHHCTNTMAICLWLAYDITLYSQLSFFMIVCMTVTTDIRFL